MAKSRSALFSDEHFVDSIVYLLSHDPEAAAILAPLVGPEDFKPGKGDRWGNQRFVVADLALQHIAKFNEPAGELLHADVIEYREGLQLTGRQNILLDDYLDYLAKVKPGNSAAIISKVRHYRQKVVWSATVDEMIAVMSSGEMTREKWAELAAAGLIVKPKGEVAEVESAPALMKARLGEQPHIVNPSMPANELMLASGKKNAGKTTLALQAAISVVTETPLFGHSIVRPGPCLFLGYEETRRDLQSKVERLKGRLKDKALTGLRFLHAVNDQGDVVVPKLDQGGLEILRAKLKAGCDGKPYVMAVVDHLIAAYTPSPGKDLIRENYQQLDPLRRLAIGSGTTIMLIHHNRKADSSEYLDDPAGSVGNLAGAGALWILRRDPNNSHHRVLHVIGRSTEEHTLKLELTEGGFQVMAEGVEAVAGPDQVKILKFLKTKGPHAPKAIADKLKLDRGNVRQLLLRMKKRHLVVSIDGDYEIRK